MTEEVESDGMMNLSFEIGGMVEVVDQRMDCNDIRSSGMFLVLVLVAAVGVETSSGRFVGKRLVGLDKVVETTVGVLVALVEKVAGSGVIVRMKRYLVELVAAVE